MNRHLTSFTANNRLKITFIVLSVIFVLLCFLGLALGSVSIPFSEFFPSLFNDSQYGTIIRVLRLPRVLGCILSGIALSISGLLLQRVTDNELASPNVVGVNSGAGFGVMLVLCFLPQMTALLPLFAFLGAVIAVIIVLGIALSVKTHQSSVALILAGVAISAIFSAGISFLSQLYPDVLSSYVVFSAGGFSSVRMKDLLVPSILILTGFIFSFFLTGKLNLLLLGDDLASTLGTNVKGLKIVCLLLASLLTGTSVSYAGLLGFVGLMVPHITSRLVGHNAKALLPASALMGADLVLLADLVGRSVFAPNEISAGIILAFVGAPFFLYLLFRKGGRHAN